MCLLDSFRASFLVEISSLLLFPTMSRPHSLSALSFAESYIPLHGTAIAIKVPFFALHIFPFCACPRSFSSDEKGKINNPPLRILSFFFFFSPLLFLTCAYMLVYMVCVRSEQSHLFEVTTRACRSFLSLLFFVFCVHYLLYCRSSYHCIHSLSALPLRWIFKLSFSVSFISSSGSILSIYCRFCLFFFREFPGCEASKRRCFCTL